MRRSKVDITSAHHGRRVRTCFPLPSAQLPDVLEEGSWIMSLPADYPLSAETLRFALDAALEAVGSGEGLTAAEIVAEALVAAAPVVASGALLDYADTIHGVDEPHPSEGEVSWVRWAGGHRTRMQAARVAGWEHLDEMDQPDCVSDGILKQVARAHAS